MTSDTDNLYKRIKTAVDANELHAAAVLLHEYLLLTKTAVTPQLISLLVKNGGETALSTFVFSEEATPLIRELNKGKS